VKSIFANDDAVGRDVDEILRTIAAYNESISNSTHIPANWYPGDRTI
jgi:alkyl hydroperoxide reductase subunit AhpC